MVSLEQVGITDWDKERLNISVNTAASWLVHALRTRPGMPAALRTLTHLKTLLISATVIGSTLSSQVAGAFVGAATCYLVASLKMTVKVVELARKRRISAQTARSPLMRFYLVPVFCLSVSESFSKVVSGFFLFIQI